MKLATKIFSHLLLVLILILHSYPTASAVWGRHEVVFIETNQSRFDPIAGDVLQIVYETRLSTFTASMEVLILSADKEETLIRTIDYTDRALNGIRTHTYYWNGLNDAGEFVEPGRYMVRASLKDRGITNAKQTFVVVGSVTDEEEEIPTLEEVDAIEETIEQEEVETPVEASNSDATREVAEDVAEVIAEKIGEEVQKALTEIDRCDGFSDVSKNDQKCNAVKFLNFRKVMTGDKGSDTFRPNDPLNRAEAAKIIALTFLQTADPGERIVGNLGHPDVDSDAWYVEYLFVAKKYGVLKGDPSGTIRPNDPVNRAEFAAMFFRAAKKDLEVLSSRNTFSDVNSNDWYHLQAEGAIEFDLLDTGVLFRGSDSMTRAEVAEWIYRFNNKNLWEDSLHI